MIVPYLDRVGVGLCLSREVVSLVALRRRFGRITLVGEEIVPLDRDEALEGLARAAPHTFVHVAVPDALLVCEVVSVPDFDEPEDRVAWANAEAARRRPAGSSLEDTVVIAHVFEVPEGLDPQQGDDFVLTAGRYNSVTSPSTALGGYGGAIPQYRAALCVVDRKRIEEALGSLQRSGFMVERVASGLLEAASLMPTSKPRSADPITVGAELPEGVEASEDLQMLGERSLPQICVQGPGLLSVVGPFGQATLEVERGRPSASTLYGRTGRERESAGDVLDFSAASGMARGDSDLDPLGELLGARTLQTSSSISAALAYEALYPGLVLVDVLSEKAQERARRVRTVVEGRRATLLVATLLLAMLALLSGIELLIGTLADRTALRLQEQAPALALLERDRAEVTRLERDVARAERSQAERTQVAFYLDALARVVPEDVTLTEMVLGPPTGVTVSAHNAIVGDDTNVTASASGFPLKKVEGVHSVVPFVIKGESETSSAIGTYSLNLERLDIVVEVRVLSVTQVSPRALRRQQRDPGQRLFTFDLAGRVAPPARADSASSSPSGGS